MDNILNRPLFRRREARDRLNDMAGVQGYQAGGPVSFGPSGAIVRDIRQPSIVPMGTIPSPVREQNLEQITLNPGTGMAARFLYNRQTGEVRLPDGSRLPSGEFEARVSEAIRRQIAAPERAGLASLTSEADQLYEQSVEAMRAGEGARGTELARRLGEVRSQIPAAQAALEAAGSLPTIPEPPETRGIMALEGPESIPPDQLDIFNRLDRAAEEAVPAAPPRSGGMAGTRGVPRPIGTGARPEAGAAGMPAAIPVPGGQGPSFEGTGRGAGPLITNPAAVAAGLNAPDPAVRERTVQDFMSEYMANAPKYEGGDKKLMHAMIGFAIAAGDSPNAMTNIANGLLAGSEMMLKDKAEKDAFNRQIQAAALQYGMGEVAKERELGRQFTDYVAGDTVTYRGTTYGPGESVPILHSDIINGRMPKGVVSEATNEAFLATDAAIRKAALDAEKAGRLAPEQYRQTIAELDVAASDFSKARNTIPLLEASIIRNAQGEVTGLKSAAIKAINQFASAAGVDLGAEFESPQAYDSAMQTVAARMVQDILGESGANISNVDRELVANIVGVVAGGYGNSFKDPQVLNAKLQEILQQAESKQQAALDTYNTLMEGFGGVLSPSGTPVRSLRADRVFAPEVPVRAFEYTVDENGKYVKRYLDGGN